MHIERVALPGIGVRYAFTTAHGHRLGVICHRDGRRELVVFDTVDPDSALGRALMDPIEADHVADLLRHKVIDTHPNPPND